MHNENDRSEPKYSEYKVSYYNIARLKSHMFWPRVESDFPIWVTQSVWAAHVVKIMGHVLVSCVALECGE